MSAITPMALDPSDLAAAGVLLRPVADDPGSCFALPDRADRDRLGPSLARAAIRFARRWGAPIATPDQVGGMAHWFPPDAAAQTEADLAESGIAKVPDLIGSDAWARPERLLNHLDALHPLHAPEPH